MKPIKHTIQHYSQPTKKSCSQAAMAMVLSYFGKEYTPERVIEMFPVDRNDKGEEWGTINVKLATWGISQGFGVEFHTADFQIIDLSWAKLPKDKLLQRMRAAKAVRNVPSLGKAYSEEYMQSYIDFVTAGGDLHIHPYMTTELIDSLLPASPILASVCFGVLINRGRSIDGVVDDINGRLRNHSIVIYGRDAKGNYLIADPGKKSEFYTVKPEQLIGGMAAAQMECDNFFFQLQQPK